MPDSTHADAAVQLESAERLVEERSGVLKKELGLGSLVLTQILYVVGLTWVGVAGKLGPPHVVFWLLAITLFYVPSAAVVIHLSGRMPLEGGLYQWAKLSFNEFTGFMVAWNLWLFVIINTSELGLLVGTFVHYRLAGKGVAALVTYSVRILGGKPAPPEDSRRFARDRSDHDHAPSE